MQTGETNGRASRWWRALLIGQRPKWTLARILGLIVAVFFIRSYVLLPVRVSGPSMMPTYAAGGINFVNRLAYLHSEPARGDVVAIRFSGDSIMMMKRIIGLPGETIAFRDGHAIVNGVMLREPYVKFYGLWQLRPEKLGPNEYFVVGDNRSVSIYGKTSRQRIVGKIVLCKSLFASSSPSR